MIRASDIHATVDWPAVLVQLGIPESALRDKHGPCPGCGGKDCFRFDHATRGRGSFYCNRIGSGDGFALLSHVHGWQFTESRRRVLEVAGLRSQAQAALPATSRAVSPGEPASPSLRVLRIRQSRCPISDCDEATAYLAGRGVAPPLAGGLFAHASVDYFDEDRNRVGKFAALVADVVDLAGELVTIHVTYLKAGLKLAGYEPRKLLGGLSGREGCAVRLAPAGPVLGVAEGLETALSAATIDGVPVWAALNAPLLAKFEPPAGTERLVIYADNDVAGLKAALQLSERLQGRVRTEPRIPPAPHKDWNDVLTAQRGLTHE